MLTGRRLRHVITLWLAVATRLQALTRSVERTSTSAEDMGAKVVLSGMVRRRSLSVAALFAVILLLPGCGSVQLVSSTALPGTPVITFPNVGERTTVTAIFSNPFTQVGGVGGRTLAISSLTGSKGIDLLTIDANGNLGLRGHIYSALDDRSKINVRPYVGDALRNVAEMHVITYRFTGKENVLRRIGIDVSNQSVSSGLEPAERLESELATEIAATQQLSREVARLRHQVALLKSSGR